jgi:hypothetical protein
MKEVEDAKGAWLDALRARQSNRSDSRARIEAQEAENRADNLIGKLEDTTAEEEVEKIEVSGVSVTARALMRLHQSLMERGRHPDDIFRLASSEAKPNQFEIKVDKSREDDRIITHNGKIVLAFSGNILSSLQGTVIDVKEKADRYYFTISHLTGK